jgi:hypothetical protein
MIFKEIRVQTRNDAGRLSVQFVLGWFMFYPAHLDGCSVVVLRQGRRGFHVVESGFLCFDGERLTLGEGRACRVFTDAEQESLMTVTEHSRIPECRGFQFFVLAESDASKETVFLDN